MLKLRKGRPPAIAVPLPGGAVAFVRPATAFEVDIAAAKAARLLAGIVEGREAAAAAVDLLGDEFREADFTTRSWLDAAAQRIALLELSAICCESWKGIVVDDGVGTSATNRPSKAHLALLLRDSECARLIGEAVRSRVHDEVVEGNVLAASPNGAAAADEATVQNVGATEAPAPMENAEPPAIAVPK